MCVGWLSVMLNGHMITFFGILGDLTSALGVIISFMIFLRMIKKVYNVTQIGHLEEIGCLNEYVVVLAWYTLTQPNFVE